MRLECRTYGAEVDAARGGLVARLFAKRGAEEIEILRPRPISGAEFHRIPFYGCFPMAPFCNRLLPPALATSEGAVDLPANWPSEGCAIHGLTLARAWRISSPDPAACVLYSEMEIPGGRAFGQIQQTLRLTDEGGLEATLRMVNTGFEWIRAGLGFHPWLHMPGEGELRFEAGGIFDPDERLLPARHRRLDPAAVSLSSARDNGLDRTFTGWRGAARLRFSHHPHPVAVESDAPCLHAFVSREFDAICAEPVTNAANAMHRAYPAGGMRRLARGAGMAISMRIALAAPEPDAERPDGG